MCCSQGFLIYFFSAQAIKQVLCKYSKILKVKYLHYKPDLLCFYTAFISQVIKKKELFRHWVLFWVWVFCKGEKDLITFVHHFPQHFAIIIINIIVLHLYRVFHERSSSTLQSKEEKLFYPLACYEMCFNSIKNS